MRRRGSIGLLTPRKAKHLVLLGPFGRQVSEANNAHAVRECAVDCSFDEIGARKAIWSGKGHGQHG